MYEFEKYLAKNSLDISVINARRFAVAIRQAMKLLQREAGCYKLNNEPYCVEINAYLEQMATRLEATPSDFKKEIIKKRLCFGKSLRKRMRFGLWNGTDAPPVRAVPTRSPAPVSLGFVNIAQNVVNG